MTKSSETKREEQHLEVMLAVNSLKVEIREAVKPAVEQTWKNTKDISVLKTKQRLTTWVGGTVITAFLLWLTKGHFFKH
jgi:CRISPR/Cas system CMR subunit Cmr6 (Cas7 group RAMP superfamily)